MRGVLMGQIDTRTEAVTKLLDGVTPGPWYAESGHVQQNGQLYWQVTDKNDAIMQNQFCWCQGDHAANAHFIAAARDLVPALLADRDALRRENENLRQIERNVQAAREHEYKRAEDALAEIKRLKAQPVTVQDAAVSDVLAERARQISAEGWTPEHDDANSDGEMAQAAACYALNAAGWKTEALRGCWPIKWMAAWFKPTDHRRDLVKSGALILAEIQRLDRAALRAIAEGRA